MIAPTALVPLVLQTAPADTMVVVPIRDAWTVTAEVAIVLIAVLMAVLLFATLGLFLHLVRMTKQLRKLAVDAQRQVAPTSAKVQAIADNLTYVTASIRQDMDRVHQSVAQLTGRLNQASDRVEDRIEEFNALLEVVQNEAEDLFIDTATTVRAVKASAKSLSGPSADSGARRPEDS